MVGKLSNTLLKEFLGSKDESIHVVAQSQFMLRLTSTTNRIEVEYYDEYTHHTKCF